MKKQFQGKKVLIMGLGLNPKGSGVSAAKFFVSRGAEVAVTDLKTKKELAPSLKLLKNLPTCPSEALKGRRRIRFILGKHNESDFKNADLVIKNPGVRQTSKYLQIAKKNNVPIETDVGIFLKNCPARVIGVTGTRGKSTTVALIGEMLKTKNPPYSPFKKGGDRMLKTKNPPYSPFKKGGDRGGFNKGGRGGIFIGGNIQLSPLNFLNQVKKDSLVVLELSSWMLEDARHPYYESTKFGEITKNKIDGFHISVLTNLMPDHLNTYKNFGDYIKAKTLIFKNQTKNDFAVLNHDDLNVRKLAKKIRAKKIWFSSLSVIPRLDRGIHKVFIKNKEIYFDKEKIASLKDITLLGEHNVSNILAAVTVAKLEAVLNQGIKKVLKTFKGLPNRLEFTREVNGIKFYNDTTSTMPQATMCALRALSQIRNPKSEIPPNPPLSKGGKGGFIQNPKSNIILIAGGSDKKLDYRKLGQEIKKYCKAVILFKGEASEKISRQLAVCRSCSVSLLFDFAPPWRGEIEQWEPRRVPETEQNETKQLGCQLLVFKNILSMKEAVKNAVKLAKKGDVILLSPGAASFGLFQNEFDRGEQFVKIVKKLCPVIQL